ncbi:MAG: iron ABC transporter permease [Hyphomicrobiaceae bacterium]|nr:iron ABC transporter permease [Hyphomicrobiaceae bacterium]MCC0011462.1 iron ABC transporter permease [Hyphomicrobiaceae bacterium]
MRRDDDARIIDSAGAAVDGASSALAQYGTVGVLAIVTLVAFVMSLMLGPEGFGLPAFKGAARLVLIEIRLPRALLGLLVGGALGITGAALQGYLRNPLAEPGLLGMTGGASLGAVIAIHTGIAAAFSLALPLGGLIGAGVTTLAVVLLAGQASAPVTLILAGVAMSSVAGALTSLVLNLAPNPFASVEMLYWMMGSLSDRSLDHVWMAAPLIVAGAALLLTTHRALDALTLGETAAQNLGVNPARLRNTIVLGSALAVGAATSVTGAIGFVGLVVPHLLRPFVAHEPGRLLVPSFLGGALLVLAADVGLRLLSPAGDLKLGVVTALLGAPFFLWLVLASRREFGA